MDTNDLIAALRRAARNLRRGAAERVHDLTVTDEDGPPLDVHIRGASEAEARSAIAGELRRLRRLTRTTH